MITPAVLDKPTAAQYLSLGVRLFEQSVQKGLIPKPRQLAGRRVGWLTKDLDMRAVQYNLHSQPGERLPVPSSVMTAAIDDTALSCVRGERMRQSSHLMVNAQADAQARRYVAEIGFIACLYGIPHRKPEISTGHHQLFARGLC